MSQLDAKCLRAWRRMATSRCARSTPSPPRTCSPTISRCTRTSTVSGSHRCWQHLRTAVLQLVDRSVLRVVCAAVCRRGLSTHDRPPRTAYALC
eukprot:1129553-Prymnesium_polylepis.1